MYRVKALFLAANPAVNKLALDEEIRAITRKIRLAQYRDEFELISAWAVRPDDLLEKLNEHRPHIVHFSGHGTSSGGLMLVGDDRLPQVVTTYALKHLFTTLKDNIQLIFLNACYSQLQAEALVEVVDCVVGMNGAVGDEAAILFAAAFYHALASGRSVENAFNQGKAALLLDGIPEEDKPQLLVKPGIDAAKLVLYPPSEKRTKASVPASSRPVRVFFSYAPEDRARRDELAKHLALMKRQGLITTWYDQQVKIGTEVAQETLLQLEIAQIILLLISPDFIASDELYEGQLQQALERHKRGTACVIPIILRPTDGWAETEFGALQALPRNKGPVDAWRNSDEAFASIASEIRSVVNGMK